MKMIGETFPDVKSVEVNYIVDPEDGEDKKLKQISISYVSDCSLDEMKIKRKDLRRRFNTELSERAREDFIVGPKLWEWGKRVANKNI